MPRSRERSTRQPPEGEPALEIGDMAESDLDQVLSIEHSCFVTPWSRESFRFEIHNSRSRNLVARKGSRILGYICVWIVGGELKINNMAVEESWRRRGVGSLLLARAMETARSAGCREATLEVRPSNRAARRLYQAHGFRSFGRRKSYYQDTREDAILMVADLESGEKE